MPTRHPDARAETVASRSGPVSGGRAPALRGGRSPGPQCVGRHRTAEEEPLRELAPEPDQRVPGRLVLDALGDDVEPEAAAQGDGRATITRSRSLDVRAATKRPVDLQLVHGRFCR